MNYRIYQWVHRLVFHIRDFVHRLYDVLETVHRPDKQKTNMFNYKIKEIEHLQLYCRH